MQIDERDLRRWSSCTPLGRTLMITGRMASDSIGMNRLIDALESQGLEVIAGSGVIRS